MPESSSPIFWLGQPAAFTRRLDSSALQRFQRRRLITAVSCGDAKTHAPRYSLALQPCPAYAINARHTDDTRRRTNEDDDDAPVPLRGLVSVQQRQPRPLDRNVPDVVLSAIPKYVAGLLSGRGAPGGQPDGVRHGEGRGRGGVVARPPFRPVHEAAREHRQETAAQRDEDLPHGRIAHQQDIFGQSFGFARRATAVGDVPGRMLVRGLGLLDASLVETGILAPFERAAEVGIQLRGWRPAPVAAAALVRSPRAASGVGHATAQRTSTRVTS